MTTFTLYIQCKLPAGARVFSIDSAFETTPIKNRRFGSLIAILLRALTQKRTSKIRA